MSTPVPQDLFSRYLVGSYDEHQIIGVSTGFQTFFGRPETGAETLFSPDANQVDIDIVRGNERIAALVPRGSIGRTLGPKQNNLRDEQFTEFSRTFPLSKEEGDITGTKLLNRVPGESPYSRQTRFERMRYHAKKIFFECCRRHVRLFEVLAAQSILTGKMDAILGTSNAALQYDFRRSATHNVTVGVPWSSGNADILGDVDAACAKIRANGKMLADMAIIGATALNSMLADPVVRQMADNRRFEMVMFGNGTGVGDDQFVKGGYTTKFAKFIAAGFIPRGLLRTPAGFELVLFTYLDVYNHPVTDAITKYMPDDKMLIAASGARCDRYFGPPETLPSIPQREQLYQELFGFSANQPPMPPNIKGEPGVIDPRAFFCDAYVSADWTRATIRCQSAPIFSTTQTDAFVCIDTEP